MDIVYSRLGAMALFLIFCSCSGEVESISSEEKEIYSKLEALPLSNYSKKDIESRSEELRNDSLKNSLYLKYSNFYYKLNDSSNFRFWNNKTLRLATKRRDTVTIGKVYWFLGNFLSNNDYNDSAYYFYHNAHLQFDLSEEDLSAGKVLLNMAILQKNIKDYEGSEITTVQAIKKLKPIGAKPQLYAAYNNLGIIYNELKDYFQSKEYHEKAYDLAESLADTLLMATSLNNIGVSLKENKELYQAADNFRSGLLIKDLQEKDAELYAMFLDNLGHTENLLNDFSKGDTLFQKALKIRESLGHEAGMTISKLHLSEYYLKEKDTTSAIEYAYQARNLAQESNNFRDLLKSLLLLSDLHKANSQVFLANYITLNDSLHQKERLVRNKFARIRFETDEFMAENQHLTEQNNWLIGGSASAAVLSFFTIIVFRQKARNRRLKNERDQQKVNEDIYKLLLDQERKIEEGKSKEKERISKELHDGVLSEMYGIRFLLNNLNDKADISSIEARQKYLEGLREIEEEIRFISHDLQNNEQFEEVGFLKILNHLVMDQEKPLGFMPLLESDSGIEWDFIDNKIKMNLYRIIQEALQNIKKYALASKVTIIFGLEEDNLRLLIRDNGKGFDVKKKSRGIGIKNMKSRIKDIHGRIKFRSNISGTMIYIKIPIKHG